VLIGGYGVRKDLQNNQKIIPKDKVKITAREKVNERKNFFFCYKTREK